MRIPTFDYLKPQFMILMAFLAFGIIAAETSDPLLPAEHPTLDHEKPVNWPTYDTHRAQAEAVCKGAVVRPGKTTMAEHVVVVRNDGRIGLMSTQEAWDRGQSKSYADNVWTIAICKKHMRHQLLER